MKRNFWPGACCFLLALVWLSLSCSASAQAVGTIVGTVTDPRGAVVAGAKVTAVNIATQVSQSTVTTGIGNFTIPNLGVATYDVTVNAAGFATGHVAGVTLDVSQTRNLDFKLSLEGLNQTAVVTEAPPLINTTDGSLAGLVTEAQVDNLPLNGRSIQNLVMLQAGMAPPSGGTNGVGSIGWESPSWVGNGNRGETTVATLDGSDATDSEMGTVQFWNFNLDAIAEFKVLQANYSAEFGQGGGTITQIVSKSGTNKFHGSAFEYIRNSAFDAKNYFSTTVPPFQRNEFGATLGGPIWKDKTFFFIEYAGLRQRLGEPTVISVPTAAERTGLVGIGGFQYQVPLNSVSQQILNMYPLPNQPNGVFGANTYNFQFKEPTNDDQYSVRIDHHLSERDSIFGRVSYINNYQKEIDPIAAIEGPGFSAENINNPRNFAISETHIFSPNLINLAIFTVNRQVEAQLPSNQSFTQTSFADGSLASWGPDTFITKYVETYYNPSDKVTWTKGRHFFHAGVEYRYGQDNGFGVASAGPNGVYSFGPGTALGVNIPSTNGGPTIMAGSGSPNGLVSMMAGNAVSYNRATTIPGFGPPGGGGVNWGLREWHIAGYLQDDLRLTPKLTVNLGLRYEYSSVPYEIRDRIGTVMESGPLFGNFVLNPKPLYKPDYAGFAPRVGAAYRATDKTVIRGGFAIFTNVIPTVYADQTAVDFPLAASSSLTSPTYSLTPLPVTLPALTSTTGAVLPPNGDPRQVAPNTPVNLAPIAAQIGSISGEWPNNNFRNGYTITGNVTLEQQLGDDTALQLSYVTNNSSSLYNREFPNAYLGAESANTPYSNVSPGLGVLSIFYNHGLFHYNALQAQVRKISPRYGFQYQASYTWSKNLTDSDSIFSAPGPSGAIVQNDPTCVRCEYARASFDVPQRLVANFSYNVPGHWELVPRMVSRGWQILGIFNAQSGFPINISDSYGTLQYGTAGEGTRPFFVKTPTKNASGSPQFLSNAVLADSQALAQHSNTGLVGSFFDVPLSPSPTLGVAQTLPGNLGRNSISGPSWWNYDMSLIKDTQVAEFLKVQFRAEFFNIFNHTTFALPGGTLGTPTFGISTATESTERQIQFGARFIF
jgi:Carboxypeptidase regulatory-like domain/TonB dependent receptor